MAPEATLVKLGELLEKERAIRRSAKMAREHLATMRGALRKCRLAQATLLDEYRRESAKKRGSQ